MNATPITTATSTNAIDVSWLTSQVQHIDDQIMALIEARSHAVQSAAQAAAAAGLSRTAQRHEMSTIARYSESLGDEGRAMAMTLMKLARTAAPTAARREVA